MLETTDTDVAPKEIEAVAGDTSADTDWLNTLESDTESKDWDTDC